MSTYNPPREANRLEFLAACGLRGPLELLVSRPGDSSSQRRTFGKPFVLIGRDPRNDLFLDEIHVSSKHVYLQAVAGGLFCLDLGIPTGISWAGEVPGSGWFLPNRVLQVGPFEIRLLSPCYPVGDWTDGISEKDDPLATRLADSTDHPGIQAEFLNVARPGAQCRLNRRLTLVGASPLCRIRLRSRTVSPFHCCLLRTPKGIWVIDLLSREGIRVNGQVFTWCRLQEGDRVQVGEIIMRLRTFPSRATVKPVHQKQEGPPEDQSTLPMVRPEAVLATLQDLPGPERSRLETSMLVPVIQQFSAMQRQMFDQFQQTLSMVVQMFSNLQHDQMELVRTELDRLGSLSKELQQLHAEMSKPPAVEEKARSDGKETLITPPSSLPIGPASQDPQMAVPTPPAVGNPPDSPKVSPDSMGPANADLHLWLNQRIAELEQERQSRWQKILGFLKGR